MCHPLSNVHVAWPVRMSGNANIQTIFVALLDEGTDVWRPVDAEPLPMGQFRILPGTDDANGELWEFAPGEIVICEERSLSGGPALIAIRSANHAA